MARKPDSHHVLPLFCDDLIASCVDMTPACFGAYMRLLCFAWTRGGLPDNEAACGRIAGGLDAEDWQQIRSRLTVLDDGRLSHDRLERERVAVAEMSAKKSEAGRKGNEARWGSQEVSQTDRKRIAERSQAVSQTDRKPIAPNPSLILEENTHTHTAGEVVKAMQGKPVASDPDEHARGWALDAWTEFAAAWNATERAEPWRHLSPPDGWVDLAASPGWLQRANEALGLLPSRRFFDRPLPVTRFFEYLDRIRAGEFADPKEPRNGRAVAVAGKAPRRGNL
jgi:uncharacterized protein YdaU (DUF1376 family)